MGQRDQDVAREAVAEQDLEDHPEDDDHGAHAHEDDERARPRGVGAAGRHHEGGHGGDE